VKLRATADAGVDGVRNALKFFATQIAERNYANEGAARYGQAQTQLMARDFKAAAQSLALVPKDATHPMIDALGARIKTAAGDGPGAIAAYRTALVKFPRTRYLELR